MQHRVEHAHARAQDRHEDDALVDERATRLRHGRDDVDALQVHVLQGLEGEEFRQLVDEFAEEFRGRRLVAHERDAVSDERMVQDGVHNVEFNGGKVN